MLLKQPLGFSDPMRTGENIRTHPHMKKKSAFQHRYVRYSVDVSINNILKIKKIYKIAPIRVQLKVLEKCHFKKLKPGRSTARKMQFSLSVNIRTCVL